MPVNVLSTVTLTDVSAWIRPALVADALSGPPDSSTAMLTRDVNNIRDTLGRFAPELLTTEFAREMWALFEKGELLPNSKLTGTFVFDESAADVDAVMDAIEEARKEALIREQGRQEAAFRD